MQAFASLFVLSLVCGQILASDERLSAECLDGSADRHTCCAGVPDAWYAHLRNPEDCGSFYQCANGKPVLMPCPAGLEWSVAGDICDYPESAQCKANNTPPTDGTTESTGGTVTTPAPEPTTPAPEPTPTPTPVDCAPPPVCHQCVTGIFPADLCCRDVQNWHKLHMGNANDCSAYYECVDDKAVPKRCPDGLHWSIKSDRCEWPSVAGCSGGGSGGGGGGGDGPGDGSGGGGGVSNDCLHGKVDAKICCKNVPVTVDVLLQNNADCHTYLQCVHGVPMVRPCPAGLWWSVTANRCEWKENATCTW